MMRSHRVALAAFMLASGLTAAPADAALHPGDKVDVTVYNHPELSGTRTLDASGNVSLPLAGNVPALDVEPSELAARVQRRLAAYVRHAAVAVQLASQTGAIFVAGGPNGVLPYQPGMTLVSTVDRLTQPLPAQPAQTGVPAVAVHDVATGGLDLTNGPVDFHRVGILRDGRSLGTFDLIALRSAGNPGPPLAPNDTIQLPNKPVAVRVAGDVEKPGTAYLDQNEPLSQALNQAGGTAATSGVAALTLVRGGERRDVALADPVFNAPAQPGDEILVPRAKHVDVVGNVEKPGNTVLRGSTTLVAAIYNAGGPSKFADLGHVQVLHGGQRSIYDLGKIRNGKPGANPDLSDGDVVLVPQGSTFQWSDVWSGIGALGLFGLHL